MGEILILFVYDVYNSFNDVFSFFILVQNSFSVLLVDIRLPIKSCKFCIFSYFVTYYFLKLLD